MTFCTIEGLDGAGGTTLVEAMESEYSNVVSTAEPSERQYGQLVRENLSNEDSHGLIDFYLFMADRIDHIEREVKPAIESGNLVVSDRYADSTRAYQPVAMTEAGLFESQWHAKSFIDQTMRPWNYEPDLTLYIDISVDTAMQRAAGDEKYEKRQFLQKVSNNYEALHDSTQFGDRIVRIDGEQSIDGVREDAFAEIDAVR